MPHQDARLLSFMGLPISNARLCFCVQLGVGDEPKRFYSTLPGPLRAREREAASNGRRKEEGSQGGGGVKHSLYQSPHLLLLQGYNRQVRMKWRVSVSLET